MNIYDEALVKLNRELRGGLYEYYEDEDLNIPIKALERAKFEHKLVGLLNEKCDYLVHIMNGAKGLQENYMKLLSKIDILEKELGDLNAQ